MKFDIKGFKTVAFGTATAAIPAALAYLAGYDWTQVVDPSVAFFVVGAINIALRFVTDSPIFKAK